MKKHHLRLVAQIVVQTGAMIFFMRVACWGIFLSTVLSALIAVIFGLVLHFIQRPKTACGD